MTGRSRRRLVLRASAASSTGTERKKKNLWVQWWCCSRAVPGSFSSFFSSVALGFVCCKFLPLSERQFIFFFFFFFRWAQFRSVQTGMYQFELRLDHRSGLVFETLIHIDFVQYGPVYTSPSLDQNTDLDLFCKPWVDFLFAIDEQEHRESKETYSFSSNTCLPFKYEMIQAMLIAVYGAKGDDGVGSRHKIQ